MMSDKNAIQEQLQKRAAELLSAGEVNCVIGWGAGRFANQTTPVFIRRPEDANQLLYNDYCVNTLAKYAVVEKTDGKVAVCVRGCDSRGYNRLVHDNQLTRDDVYLIGVPCGGMLDRKNGEMLFKCQQCTWRDPVACDEMIGEKDDVDDAGREERAAARFKGMDALSKMAGDKRKDFFDTAFERCIRCYACRTVCPCCTCKECFVDQHRVGWEGVQHSLAENRNWTLTRLWHIADRCIECSECERVCPMNLPLMMLNRRMIKDMEELFAAEEAGLSAEQVPTLGTYDVNDVEEFM
jgi:ferredoxin